METKTSKQKIIIVRNLDSFIKDACLASKHTRLILFKAKPKSVDVVKNTLGFDANQFTHTVDNIDVRHAIKRHSQDSKKLRKNEIPLSLKDIQLIPIILSNPDSVSVSLFKTGRGLRALKYKKTVEEQVYYIEEIRRVSKTLAFKTMYKEKVLGSSLCSKT